MAKNNVGSNNGKSVFSNLREKPQPWQYLVDDQVTGQAMYNTDAVLDFWGRLVHKNNVLLPSAEEYRIFDAVDPVVDGRGASSPGGLYPLAYFPIYNNNTGKVIGVYSSQDYSPGQKLQATSAQIAAYTPVVTSTTMYTPDPASPGYYVGTVSATYAGTGGLTFSITAGNTGNAFIIDAAGDIYVADGSHVISSNIPIYSLTVAATPNLSNLVGTGTITIQVGLLLADLIKSYLPAAYIEMVETSGTSLTDQSTHSNTFTLNSPGAQSYVLNHTQLYIGMNGKSIYENTGGFAIAANTTIASYQFTNKLSGVIFAKPADNGGFALQADLISRWTSTNKSFQFGFLAPTGGSQPAKYTLELSGDGSTSSKSTYLQPFLSFDQTTHMYSFSYDGATQTVKLYIDGLPQTLSSTTGTVPTSLFTPTFPGAGLPLLQVGNATSTSDMGAWFGDLAHAAVFPSVLTDAQMLMIWNAANGIY